MGTTEKDTALQRPKSNKDCVSRSGDASNTQSSQPLFRSNVPSTTVTSTGVLKNVCIFCNNSEDTLTSFNQHTWSQVQASAEVRQNMPNLRSFKHCLIINSSLSSFLPQINMTPCQWCQTNYHYLSVYIRQAIWLGGQIWECMGSLHRKRNHSDRSKTWVSFMWCNKNTG